MKKFMIFVFISLVIGYAALSHVTRGIYKSYIGESIELNGDTLVITDYSLYMQSFQLSNGAWVNYKLIESKNED